MMRSTAGETLEAQGPESLEGVFVVSYPRPDISEKFGPGASATRSYWWNTPCAE